MENLSNEELLEIYDMLVKFLEDLYMAKENASEK
jgi:hypothetical protein